MKYTGVIISGALAGLAGAYLVLEGPSVYLEGQTNGRGFIGLASLLLETTDHLEYFLELVYLALLMHFNLDLKNPYMDY